MSDERGEFRREYLLRLPLPLAQLYSRAYNAKDARSRHDNAFYLCEALIKLAAAPAAACYLAEVEQGAPRAPTLDRALASLALPSLGQWVGMLRELARHFATRVDAPSHPLGRLFNRLDEARGDRPALVALYRRIKNGPDGAPSGDSTVSLSQLFDALVQYRNGVFGHGAGRFDTFFADEMGPLLFPAVNELLGDAVLEPLGPPGSRLAYITELRTLDDGRTQVGLRELVGLQGERTAPLELAAEQVRDLLPNRVVVLWPGRGAPLRLDPLLQYREGELAEEVLFLNRDRNGRQVEYLSYTTGRTERDKSMLPAMAALLSRVTNHTVAEADLARLTEQSLAATPSLEALFEQPPAAGRQIGDYELLAELGRGGMGVVYLAKQLSLGRLVALKMLPGDLAADDVALARFRREIRHLARCDHPNIVKVLGSGALPDGRLYYAMEYVPGSDLGHVWRELSEVRQAGGSTTLGDGTWARAVWNAGRKRREKTESSQGGIVRDPTASETPPRNPMPLPPMPAQPTLPDAAADPGGYVRRVVALVRDTALALQTVHEQGIVHRDVSPDNLMLTPDGSRVVLMDFGLAKGQTQMARSISEPGGFVGKLRYAAPEQLAAAKLKVGPQADVRALGVTLWELLTRKRLFAEADDEAALAVAVHDHDVPRLRSIDPTFDRDLEAIVARACERRQSDRIQSAGRLAEYLQLYLDDKPLPIRTPGLGELARRWIREHKTHAAALTASATIVLAVTTAAFVLIDRERAAAVKLSDDLGIVGADLAKALARSERQQAALAAETAEALFRKGCADCAAGKLFEGRRLLLKAVRLAAADNPLRSSYERVAIDRFEFPKACLLRQGGAVGVVAFSPDGTCALTASSEGHVALWDTLTGDALPVSMSHQDTVLTAAFSSDGERVITGSRDRTAQVWEVATGAPLGDRLRHEKPVLAVAFGPDGNRVLTGSEDKTAQLWDATSGRRIGSPMQHETEVSTAVFSPDGTRLLTGCMDHSARLWDATNGLPTGEVMRRKTETAYKLPLHQHGLDDRPLCLFSPNGASILTSVPDGGAQLWEAATGFPQGSKLEQLGLVGSAAFSPDGARVVLGSFEHEAGLWNVATREPLGEPMVHADVVEAVAFNPDGTTVLTGSRDGTVRIWDAASGRPLNVSIQLDDEVLAVAYSPDGLQVLVGCEDGYAYLWDSSTNLAMGEPMRHETAVETVAFHPDGSRIAAGTYQEAQLWDVATRKRVSSPIKMEQWLKSIEFDSRGTRLMLNSDEMSQIWDFSAGRALGKPLRHARGLNKPAVSPDGTRLLTLSDDHTAQIWDAADGRTSGEPMRHAGSITKALFSPDGKRAVTAGEYIARLWDAADGRPIGAPMEHQRYVRAVTFSPDGARLLTASGDQAHLWNAADCRPIGTPLQHKKDVTSVAFGPRGKLLLTVSEDRAVRIWDGATGLPIGEPIRHERSVTAATFSPDGTRLLTCSENMVQLWDFMTGVRLKSPLRHQDEQHEFKLRYGTGESDCSINAFALSADGQFVVTGSNDGTARLWDVSDVPLPSGPLDWLASSLGGTLDEQGDLQSNHMREREISLVKNEWHAVYNAYRRRQFQRRHEQLAYESLDVKNWNAAELHLRQLILSDPEQPRWKAMLDLVLRVEVVPLKVFDK